MQAIALENLHSGRERKINLQIKMQNRFAISEGEPLTDKELAQKVPTTHLTPHRLLDRSDQLLSYIITSLIPL